jgi:hypothetical protein
VDHTDFFKWLLKLIHHRRVYHIQITHSPITLTNLSSINLISILRCSSPPNNPVYVRRVDPSALVFSLSSHRHSYIVLLFSYHFMIHNKQFFFLDPHPLEYRNLKTPLKNTPPPPPPPVSYFKNLPPPTTTPPGLTH